MIHKANIHEAEIILKVSYFVPHLMSVQVLSLNAHLHSYVLSNICRRNHLLAKEELEVHCDLEEWQKY